MRIAVGGIGHESNTFSTLRTRLEDFSVRRGEEITQGERWDAYRAEGVTFLPTLSAGASPHGLVALDAYRALKSELLERLEAVLPVDGVYMTLHGAMEVEEIGDGESDLVSAVRERVGNDALISCSLDLHGNIAPAFVAASNILTALRTAPHRDGLPTHHRALGHLVRAIREGVRPATVMVKPPLLLPGEFAVTEVEPSRTLYSRLEVIQSVPGLLDASLMIGCAWTDSPHTSTSVLVVSSDDRYRETAYREAARLAREVWEKREAFGVDVETVTVDEAAGRALAAPESPVFLSDSGDNVTAGGAGDNSLLLEHLLRAGAKNAVVGGLTDPEAVARCVDAGVGARLTLAVGGKLDRVNGHPLTVTGSVKHLGDGSAVLDVDGVEVVLLRGRGAFASRDAFRRVGIEAMERKIVVVKLGYLFPDLRDHAPLALMVLSPGFTDLRMEALPFEKVRRPIFPLDRDFDWSP
jgi:microcystin degradation protein MlrC